MKPKDLWFFKLNKVLKILQLKSLLTLVKSLQVQSLLAQKLFTLTISRLMNPKIVRFFNRAFQKRKKPVYVSMQTICVSISYCTSKAVKPVSASLWYLYL